MLLHLFFKAVGLQMLLTWNAAQELNETQLSVDQEILQAYLSSNASQQMSDPSYVRVQIDMLFEAAAYREMIRTPDNDSNSTRRVRRKAFRDESLRWPNATVPYILEATFNNTESEALRQAITDYHTYSCVRFRDALPGDVDYLRIVDGRGCLSYVGRQGGMQELILARRCRRKGVIIHELGHALGFVHEHSRPDRDLYVSIKTDNILDDYRYDFEKFNDLTVTVAGIPYDYESIMHYGSYAMARNMQSIVIETKNASYQNIIGQRNSLSFRDVKLVNMMFQCSERSRCPRKSCPGEGFVGYDCRCWCPSGKNNIAAVHCPEASSFAEVCTLGWTESGDFCYLVTNSTSWGAAQQECRRLNAYLVDIRNLGEQTSLYDFLNSRGVEQAWIGLNDLRAEGQWAWDSGERVTYVNWAAGEPNDDLASEDCVEVVAMRLRGWNDIKCNTLRPGVCRGRKAGGICTLGWTESGDFCYLLTDQKSWGAAQQECRRMNAYLVDVRNLGDQTSLYDFLNSRGVERAWIGLNDLRAEGQWAWDSGERVTYVNWAAGEPNDDLASEDCVEVLDLHLRGWNDNKCNTLRPGVCRKRKGRV